jgi:hypothetical protein
MTTDRRWWRVTDKDGKQWMQQASAGEVLYLQEGDVVEEIVILTVEEYKRLLGVVGLAELLRRQDD